MITLHFITRNQQPQEKIMTIRARNLRDDETPARAHDCEACVYLGTRKLEVDNRTYDFYFCAEGNGDGTLIARYGLDGDYKSIDLAIHIQFPRDMNDPLEWAYCAYLVASW
jgi:hypothetical protein